MSSSAVVTVKGSTKFQINIVVDGQLVPLHAVLAGDADEGLVVQNTWEDQTKAFEALALYENGVGQFLIPAPDRPVVENFSAE